MRWTEGRKNAALVLVVTLVALGAAEMLLRFLKPQPTYSRLASQVGSYYAPSSYNTFELQKNYAGFEPSMEFPGRMVEVRTNSRGFRGPELDAGKAKILVLGDSFTFGMYVGNEETYPAVLDRLLRNRHPHYQVVNAGFADGFETDQHYVWLKHNLEQLAPKVVVLGFFVGNDIYGISPHAWAELDRDGLPGKWIEPGYQVSADGVLKDKSAGGWKLLALEYAYRLPVLRESHLFILVGKVLDRVTRRLGGSEGYADHKFQHIFGVYSDDFLAKEAIFLKLAQAMKDLCGAHGARFMAVLLPVNFMVESEKLDLVLPGSKLRGRESVYHARLRQLLADRGIAVLDIESEMKRARSGPYFPSNGEVHFNPRGNAFTGERLYEFLASNGYLQ